MKLFDILSISGAGCAQTAMTSSKLADILHCTEREIRRKVQTARRDGKPIVGCRRGYYIASTYDEVAHYAAKLHKRARELDATAMFMQATSYQNQRRRRRKDESGQ